MPSTRGVSLASNAPLMLHTRLEELYEFAPYISDPTRVDELHNMRIAAKRLRYTMEIFAALLPRQGFCQAVRPGQVHPGADRRDPRPGRARAAAASVSGCPRRASGRDSHRPGTADRDASRPSGRSCTKSSSLTGTSWAVRASSVLSCRPSPPWMPSRPKKAYRRHEKNAPSRPEKRQAAPQDTAPILPDELTPTVVQAVLEDAVLTAAADEAAQVAQSDLEGIPYLGAPRRLALALAGFATQDDLRRATVEQIGGVKGVGTVNAARVKEWLPGAGRDARRGGLPRPCPAVRLVRLGPGFGQPGGARRLPEAGRCDRASEEEGPRPGPRQGAGPAAPESWTRRRRNWPKGRTRCRPSR